MGDVRKMYEKDFIFAYDLDNRDVTLTIAKVTQGTLVGEKGKTSKKPVVHFREAKKGLGLCITNARTIAALYGGYEVEKWIGKKVTLYPTTTTFGDKTVDCIRIRNVIPGQKQQPPSPQSSLSQPPPDDDDEAARRAAEPTAEERAAWEREQAELLRGAP